MEYSTTGLPVKTYADRARDIVRKRGFVAEARLLRMLAPGTGHERHDAWSALRSALTDGSLIVVWTSIGAPFYLSPERALRVVQLDRMRWAEDGTPYVRSSLDLEV